MIYDVLLLQDSTIKYWLDDIMLLASQHVKSMLNVLSYQKAVPV